MSAQEGSSSPHVKVIASRFEDLAILFKALAEPDRSGGWVEPETPEVEEAKREVDVSDIVGCIEEGDRAKEACKAAGVSRIETCIAIGKIAEGDCLKAKLKELKRK